MLRLAVLSCVISACLAAPFAAELDSEWEAYKTVHSKQYEADVEPLRYIDILNFYFQDFKISGLHK